VVAAKRWLRWVLGVGLAVVLAGVFLATWHAVSPSTSPITALLVGDPLPAVPRPTRPATLDPDLFTGRAVAAYRLARERQALLERLPCYCGCYGQAGHQNLLDCFRDGHAGDCEVCLHSAERAGQLDGAGYTPADIKALLDVEFSRKMPHSKE